MERRPKSVLSSFKNRSKRGKKRPQPQPQPSATPVQISYPRPIQNSQNQENTYLRYDSYGPNSRTSIDTSTMAHQQNRQSYSSSINSSMSGYIGEPVQVRARPPTIKESFEPIPSTSKSTMYKSTPLLIQTSIPEQNTVELEYKHQQEKKVLQNRIHELELKVAQLQMMFQERALVEQHQDQLYSTQHQAPIQQQPQQQLLASPLLMKSQNHFPNPPEQPNTKEEKQKDDKNSWKKFIPQFDKFNWPLKKNNSKSVADLETIAPVVEKYPLVPKALVELVDTLESNAVFMQTYGIYRISGNQSAIQQLRKDANNKKFYKIRENQDPIAIAGFIKMFLRELKEPLLSYGQLQVFIPHLKDFPNDYIDAKIGKLGKLLQSIPERNKESLKFLIKHLDTVTNIEENNMSAKNLSMLFGPCIVFDVIKFLPDEDPMLSFEIPNLCIETMINNYDDIFESKTELKQEDDIDTDQSSDHGTAV